MKRSISFVFGLALCSGLLFGQNRTRFAGLANAADYAYGVTAAVSPLRVDIGNTATGAGTVTLAFGFVTLGDGTMLTPLSTTAPIVIGVGTNAETVTPSAVSCATPLIVDTCTVTATFSNLHGIGDLITSGTYGLVEAVNAQHTLGGLVAIDGRWVQIGGSTGTITGNKGFTNVSVLDWRGTTAAVSYTSTSNGVNMTATAHVLY
jgi:hypothetical protein